MSKQKKTISDKMPLKKWETMAIELRYEGYTYDDTAEIIKKTLPDFKSNGAYLRNKFMRGTPLYQAYEEYCEKLNEESIKEGKNAIASAHKVASKTIVALMGKKYPASIRLASAKEVADRNIGKALQREDINITSMDDLRKEWFDKLKGDDEEQQETDTK